MTSEQIRKSIQEHEALQKQIKWWRWGTSTAVVVITVFCVAFLYNEVHNLFVPGIDQQVFASTLTGQLKKDVLPSVTDMAKQALTESKPQVQAAFTKLNDRVPELTAASLKQFEILQKELPEHGDAALQASYGQMIQQQEPKIKAQFPNVTDADVQAFATNMTQEGQSQIVEANNTLFAKHTAALNAIQADITKIQNTEPVTADQDKANWEMAVLVVDDFHSDLQGLQSQKESAIGSSDKAGSK